MTKFRWVAYLGVCDGDVESRLPLQARGFANCLSARTQSQALTALSRSFAASRGYCGSVILTGSRISAISSSVSCFLARAISIIDLPVATDSFTISAALAYPIYG